MDSHLNFAWLKKRAGLEPGFLPRIFLRGFRGRFFSGSRVAREESQSAQRNCAGCIRYRKR